MAKQKNLNNKIFLLVVIVSAISGAAASFVANNFSISSEDALIYDFYMTENAVYVSPHSIRKAMDNGDSSFVLVDLRSKEEYEMGHIVGAINIPAYKDPDTPAYSNRERIIREFSKLPKDKDIIVYCYSMSCMTGRKIGKMLAEHGIYVKHLGIGWNEWRYFWNLWNHEGEWNSTDVNDYIAKGSEPGIPKILTCSAACGIEGEFGC